MDQSAVVENSLEEGGEVEGHATEMEGSKGSLEIRVVERSGVGVNVSSKRDAPNLSLMGFISSIICYCFSFAKSSETYCAVQSVLIS